ncbi:MAG: GlsB/YeaQ/YmgE family stress response membrane protein [Thermomicrobiaceae bacterium]
MDLNPGNLVAWIIVGFVAGWLGATLSTGRGFGCLGNTAIGLAGAIIGGLLFSALGFSGTSGFLGSLVIASIGAALLLVLASLLGGRR